MKIGFNARLLASANLRGWNRYTVNLLAELPKLGIKPILYSDRPIDPSHLARIGIGQESVRVDHVRPYLIWEQHWLPRQCKLDAIDLFHAPANFGLPKGLKVPRVLTLHDAIDAAYYAKGKSWKETLKVENLRSKLTHATARYLADCVITVSPHAESDLNQVLGIPKVKIRVTPEAADPIFHRLPTSTYVVQVRERHNLRKPYVFYVGGWEGRKNIPFLLRAFAEAGLQDDGIELVLAGGKPSEIENLRKLAESYGVTQSLRPIGWVEDVDLPALYSEALCLVYPSEYEGFGLQICEAFAVGCPVLAARATSLPWVVGSGGETFSLESTVELSRLLGRVAREPDYRSDLKKRAKIRSADFSWRATAEATVEIYEALITSKSLLSMHKVEARTQ